jgi:hypothetical protein
MIFATLSCGFMLEAGWFGNKKSKQKPAESKSEKLPTNVIQGQYTQTSTVVPQGDFVQAAPAPVAQQIGKEPGVIQGQYVTVPAAQQLQYTTTPQYLLPQGQQQGGKITETAGKTAGKITETAGELAKLAESVAGFSERFSNMASAVSQMGLQAEKIQEDVENIFT